MLRIQLTVFDGKSDRERMKIHLLLFLGPIGKRNIPFEFPETLGLGRSLTKANIKILQYFRVRINQVVLWVENGEENNMTPWGFPRLFTK